MSVLRTGLCVAAAALLAVSASCGGGRTERVEVTDATFSHGLSADKQAVDAGSEFEPDETVCLSLTVKGRPKPGTVKAKFCHGDAVIAEADAGSGMIVTAGEHTRIGYRVTHEKPLPIGADYRADIYYEGNTLGTYTFSIIPPEGAPPATVTSATLARGRDENYNPVDPTTVFGPLDVVHFAVRGDFCMGTTLRIDWYVGGAHADDATTVWLASENVTDFPMVSTFIPKGGWPLGEHEVVLTLNGEEAGRYTFTIEQ